MTELAPFIVRTDAFFLPSALRQLQKPEAITFTWSSPERKICRKRKPVLTSSWAEKNRSLTAKDSDRDGPWRNEVTPYLVGIMDAVFYPSVRQMVVCAPPPLS